jgi:radical SAM protein with 4Fe4S-binding SPASM domain
MYSIKLPKTAILELTYACNHACKFCSCPWEDTLEKHEEMPVGDWKKALHILENRGVERIGLSGGEPLLKAEMPEILRYIRSDTALNKGKKITVITNSLAMNEEFISLFNEANAHLSFSLPGLVTFSYHTGSEENSAGNVLHWMRRAKAEGLSTTLNVTATKKNIHELYEIIANGLIVGADTLLLNRFMVGGRGVAYQEDLSLSREQIVEMLDIAEDVLETAGRKGYLGIEIPLCILEDEKKYKHLNISSMCAGANRFFVIDPSGYLRVCNHSPKRVGHILDENLFSDMDYWRMYTKRNFCLPKMCDGCELRERCDCGCREASAICYGSLSSPDPCVYDMNDRYIDGR